MFQCRCECVGVMDTKRREHCDKGALNMWVSPQRLWGIASRATESGCITNEYVPYLLIVLLSVCLLSTERFPLLWSCASITQTKPGCWQWHDWTCGNMIKMVITPFQQKSIYESSSFLKKQYPPRNPFNQKALWVAHWVYLLILVCLAEKSIS